MQTKFKLNVQTRLIFALLAFAPFLLSGCGADDIVEAVLDSNGYKIDTFDVYGTNDTADIENSNNNIMQAPIVLDGGNFHVHWTTRDENELYEVELYASVDQNLSERSDVRFFSDTCGSVTRNCDRNANSNLACSFTNDNINDRELTCGNDIVGRSIESVLTSGNVITDGAYIIIKTCNVTEFSCENRAHPVIFQVP
ncbi:hypothetical protein [Kaarinaea lacus]